MKKIPITEATATQLAEFASTILGIEVNFRMGADAILGKAERKIKAAIYTHVAIEPLRRMLRIALGEL